jgi:hypothetical protein
MTARCDTVGESCPPRLLQGGDRVILQMEVIVPTGLCVGACIQFKFGDNVTELSASTKESQKTRLQMPKVSVQCAAINERRKRRVLCTYLGAIGPLTERKSANLANEGTVMAGCVGSVCSVGRA